MEFRVFKKYNIVYGEGIATPAGRLSFPFLTEKKPPLPPKEGEKEQGVPKYEVTILLDKKDPSVKAFISELEEIAEEMVPIFNQGAQNEIAKVKRIVRDGDMSDLEKYPQENGKWLLTARSKDLPDLLGKDPAEFKAGVSVRLVVEPSLSNGGLGFGLKVVQFVSDDGTRFSGTRQNYRSLLEDINDDQEEAEDKDNENGGEVDSESSSEKESTRARKESDEAVGLSAREKAKAQAEANARASRASKGGKGKSAAVNLL